MRNLLVTPLETIEADLASLQTTTSRSPVFQTRTEPDACVYWSELPLPVCNVIANARIPAADVPQRAAELLAPFLKRGRPFQWVTTPATTTPALEAALAQAGLRPQEAPAMHLKLTGPIDPRTPDDVFIDLAWPEQVQSVSRTLVTGLHYPAGLETAHLRFLETLDPAENQCFIARSMKDGSPVGASTMHRRSASVMLANMATLESARGRGVGRALTATMLNRARETGSATASLVANEAGYPVAIDVGFRTMFNVVTWVWSPLETE